MSLVEAPKSINLNLVAKSKINNYKQLYLLKKRRESYVRNLVFPVNKK